MMGTIMFSIIKTRPDIVFAIFFISQFAKNLSHLYIKVVKTFLKYLKSLKHYEITYKRDEELKIEYYLDLD